MREQAHIIIASDRIESPLAGDYYHCSSPRLGSREHPDTQERIFWLCGALTLTLPCDGHTLSWMLASSSWKHGKFVVRLIKCLPESITIIKSSEASNAIIPGMEERVHFPPVLGKAICNGSCQSSQLCLSHKQEVTLLLSVMRELRTTLNIPVLFLSIRMHVIMSSCMHTQLMQFPAEARRGCHLPWSCSYGRLWTTTRGCWEQTSLLSCLPSPDHLHFFEIFVLDSQCWKCD